MNQDTAEAFVIHFALKYFPHVFPQEVMDALKAGGKAKQNHPVTTPGILLEWENKISIQSHWKGVIEDYNVDKENAVAQVIKSALLKTRQLKIKYQEKPEPVVFNPFGLVIRSAKFYLVGSFEESQQPYLLGIDKITQIQLLEQQALRPQKDFILDDFSEAFLTHPTSPEIIDTLVVEFPEKAFYYVKSHPIKCEQLHISDPQGTPGYFHLNAYKVKNTLLLHQWLGSFHDDAYIIKPHYIRQQINRSLIDQLTNLYNRKAFERIGSREIDRCYRDSNCYFSILVMDIDHFKNINDRHGHVFGDEVLIKVAECFRDYDAIRYGGEEFVILLPHTHAVEADCAAERIRQSIESLVIKSGAGDPVAVTLSIGIAEFPLHLSNKDRDSLQRKEKFKLNTKTKGSLMDAIIKQADKALYQAKETGRNQSVIIQGEPVL